MNKNEEITGVCLSNKTKIFSRTVVLTTGTFLKGMIHIGEKTIPAGRVNEAPSVELANFLYSLGLNMGRLKTGTPPRIDGSSINWKVLKKQRGDQEPEPFSTLTDGISNEQIDCGIAWTNKKNHQLIKENIGKSAMYSGKLDIKGPRYCPSIEDKIMRFGDLSKWSFYFAPRKNSEENYN